MIISIIIIIFIFTVFIIITRLKLLSLKKNNIEIYNKIAKLQYNRLNNPLYINQHPFVLFTNSVIENSYTVLDKIV